MPDDALFVETQSRSTSENLVQASAIAKVIGARRVLVVSDPLHELRAITIARDLGLDAYPSPTPTSRYVGLAKQARFLARETYFYSRYLLHRTVGSDAAQLSHAAERAQRDRSFALDAVARAR